MDAGLDMAARVHRGTYGELVPTTEKEGEGTDGTHCFLTFTQSQVGVSMSRRGDVAANRSAADLLRRCGSNRNRETAWLAPGIGGGWHGRGGSLFKGRLA